LPAPSVACTLKVCGATLSPLYACGLVQAVKVAPSSEHWKLEPASVEVNEKLALVDVVGFVGFAVIVVSGGVVSVALIVQLELAGDGSGLPAASVARTWNVCPPTARPLYCCGLEQAVNGALSSEHVKLAPASELKVNDAVVAVVGFDGPEAIVVSGAPVSTVHVWIAGVASVLPAPSFARTLKVCEPSPRPL
jgi:hypothetical protein